MRCANRRSGPSPAPAPAPPGPGRPRTSHVQVQVQVQVQVLAARSRGPGGKPRRPRRMGHGVVAWGPMGTTYAIRAATGRKFCPTQPPLGLGRRWDGLEVAGGVQLGT
jgi:hypothetical protein